MRPPREVNLKRVAVELLHLARERIGHLRPIGADPFALPPPVGGAELDKLLVNAYLQGAIDGSTVQQQRFRSRGRYRRRA